MKESKYHLYCSCVGCKEVFTTQNLNRHYQATHINKNYCKWCGNPIKQRQKFCDHSCSAKHSNANRQSYYTSAAFEKQKLTVKQTLLDKFKHLDSRYKNECTICGRHFTSRYTRKTCSAICTYQSNVIHCRLMGSSGGKASAAVRVKRSKNEVKLFDLIKSIFPDALNNHIIADGWDADIVIPILKTAILWNGPWHYKQLSIRNHSLKQVQNRDRIKTELFKKMGWNVYIFEDRYYTPETAFAELTGVLLLNYPAMY